MRLKNIFLVVPMFATVLCAADRVEIGTWKFNPEKSKVSVAEATERKGETLKIEAIGEFTVRLTFENPNGTKRVSTAEQDGKEHPYEEVPGLISISTRIDARHGRRVFMRDGKIEQTLEISHSADGKTRTVTRKGIRNGKEIPQPWIEVYDRQ